MSPGHVKGRRRLWRGCLVPIALCLAASLTECADVPTTVPLSPSVNAAAIEARSLDDPRLRQFIAAQLPGSRPDGAWDLARLTLAAMYYHPDLEIARAGLVSAEAAVVTAGQRPNPVLHLAAAFGTSAAAGAIPAAAAPLILGPIIDLMIETAGKREYRTARAGHLAEAARQAVSTALWRVRGGVRAALLDLWAAQRRVALVGRRLALQEELVGLLEARLAAGAVGALDVSRERLVRAQSALAVGEAERMLADTRARLASAIGLPLKALDGLALSLGVFDSPPPLPADASAGELRRRALTGRSDVAAGLAQYAAAQAAVQLAMAEQYPNLTLGPGYQYDFGVHKYLLDAAAPLPLFHRNEGPIAEAMAARQTMAARFTALQAEIIGAIDRAAADYRARSATLARAETLLADSRNREAQVRRSFEAGRLDRPSLLTAELERVTAELSRLDAAVEQRRALGGLEDALQYPLFGPATAPPAAEPGS